MNLNLSCGTPLHKWVKVAALILIVLSSIEFAYAASSLVIVIVDFLGWREPQLIDETFSTTEEIVSNATITTISSTSKHLATLRRFSLHIKNYITAENISLLILWALSYMEVYWNVSKLLKGACRRDTVKCKHWIIINIVVITINVGLSIWDVVSYWGHLDSLDFWNLRRTSRILSCLISVYTIVVVYAFILETNAHNSVERWIEQESVNLEDSSGGSDGGRGDNASSKSEPLPFKIQSQVPLVPPHIAEDRPILNIPAYRNAPPPPTFNFI